MEPIQKMKEELAAKERECAELLEKIKRAEYDEVKNKFPLYRISNNDVPSQRFVVKFLNDSTGEVVFTRIDAIVEPNPGCQHWPRVYNDFIPYHNTDMWKELDFSTKRRLPDGELVVGWNDNVSGEPFRCSIGTYNVSDDSITVIDPNAPLGVHHLHFDNYNPIWRAQEWQ